MPAATDRATFKDYCLDNKYTRWYFNIIENAISRGWNKKTSPVYVENHHIVPKSIIKNNDVVTLTAREHFICHVLLTRMLVGKNKDKMVFALWNISHHMKNLRKLKINSKTYNRIKQDFSKSASIKSSGSNNPMYGKTNTGYKHTKEHKEYFKDLMSGTNNPMYGKQHTEEHKQFMSNRMSGVHNPMYGKVGKAFGKKWYHDPITKQQKYFIQGQQPDSFVLGRG